MNLRFNKSKLEKNIRKEQLGIFNRYLREHENWKDHLDHSKKMVVKLLSDSKSDSIAILGSGWLLDVPVDFLLSNFKIIYFIDIIHPKLIKRKYSKYSQIKFIDFDVTQTWQSLIKNPSTFDFRPPKSVSLAKLAFAADIVVSLNLLSQLGEIPFDYFLLDKINNQKKASIKRYFQTQHLDFIQKFKQWILISDIYEKHLTIENEIIHNDLIFCTLPESFFKESWKWNFDNFGHYIIGVNEVKKIVKCYSNL